MLVLWKVVQGEEITILRFFFFFCGNKLLKRKFSFVLLKGTRLIHGHSDIKSHYKLIKNIAGRYVMNKMQSLANGCNMRGINHFLECRYWKIINAIVVFRILGARQHIRLHRCNSTPIMFYCSLNALNN